jgi:hypothetical protein
MLKLILLIFLILFSFKLKAQELSDRPITVHSNGKSFENVINDLSKEYHLPFYFSSSKINTKTPIYLKVDQLPITQVLDLLKKQAEFDYKITNTQIILYLKPPDPEMSKLVSVHGFIQDKVTGERLIGANIVFPEISRGTITNPYGYFTFSLPAGKYAMRCSFIGYSPLDTILDISKINQVIFNLSPSTITLKEVHLVNKSNDRITSMQTGYDEVPVKMLRIFPTLMGEKDALQFMKLLPGIKSSNEGSGGLFIRGALPSQTTFLIDDAPLYNMYHLSGIFSTVNADAIKDIRIHKSNLPVKTGGALSSIIDIRLRDGSNQKYIVSGGIGTISSSITVEGPIIKDKASFIVSARRSYIDEFFKLFDDLKELTVYFYDIHTKLNYIVNSKNRLYLSGYAGRDYLETEGGIKWGNSLLSFRWNRVFTPRLFANLTFTSSNYKHTFFGIPTVDGSVQLYTTLKNNALKYDFTYSTKNNHKINFGINTNYIEMNPFSVNNPTKYNLKNKLSLQQRFISQVYGDVNLILSNHWDINAGARLSAMKNLTHTNEDIIIKPEPSVGVKYQITSKSSAKIAYSRNYQFFHGATIFDMLIPFERIIYCESKLPPQYADHVSAGYFFRQKDENFELALETYYSWMYNLSRFKLEDQVFLENTYYEYAILGKAQAYGIELSIRKQLGRFKGMLSYTLAKIDKKEYQQKSSSFFNPYYDRRHDLSLSLGMEVSKRVTLSGIWAMMTGNPYNRPTGKYEIRGRTIPLYSDNLYNSRMPFYHRLDLGCHIKLGKGTRVHHSLSFNVYNIYLKNNPIMYYFKDVADADLLKDIETSQYSSRQFSMVSQYVFKFVPSFSYEFKFE